jgi:hypothetical protein
MSRLIGDVRHDPLAEPVGRGREVVVVLAGEVVDLGVMRAKNPPTVPMDSPSFRCRGEHDADKQ